MNQLFSVMNGGKKKTVTPKKSKPTIYTFPNGFRIIHEHIGSNNPISSAYAFCNVGSAYETKESRGMSHYIEHMCFKGTKKVPIPRDIFIEFDKSGAYFNAATDKRFTYYIVKMTDEHMAGSLNMISDMMLNSTFSKSSFHKEEKVVVEENIKNSDDPSDKLDELVEASIYDGTSFEQPVDNLGFHKKTFDRNKVLAFYDRFYRPENMVLSVVSNLSFDTVLNMVKKTDFVRTKERKPSDITVKNPLFHTRIMTQLNPMTEPKWILEHKSDLNTAYISISFRTCFCFSKDRYVLNFVSNILSSSFSSRLFTVLREDHGLTYSSYSTTNYNEAGGDFSIYIEVNNNKVMNYGREGGRILGGGGGKNGVIPILVDLLKSLKKGDVTEKEISLAKSNLRGKMILKQEHIVNRCKYNGEELIILGDAEKLETDGIVPYNELYDKHYKNITMSEINEVVHRYFGLNNMIFGIVSSKLPKLEELKPVFSGL